MAVLALLVAAWLAVLAWRRRSQQQPGWKAIAGAAAAGAAAGLGFLIVDLESQKMLARLATPLGMAWLALGTLAAVLLARRNWRPGSVAAGCWLLLTLGGNAWLAAALLGSLEHSLPTPQAQRWDAIAVLGGGTGLDPDGGPQLACAGDRLRVAAALLREGRAPVLVSTGSGLFDQGPQRDLSRETADIVRGWGIVPADMLLIPGPVNTKQEIVRLAEEARARGWRRIAVVSSGWHLPRALALARRHGLPADGIPADRRGRAPAASPLFLIPCGSGMQDIQLWCNEALGRLVGR